VYDPYRNLGRVVRRSDRILRRMVAARMITEEEYRAALAEEPNVEGLSSKVETTMASPPPGEMVQPPDSGTSYEPESPAPETTSPRDETGAENEPPPGGPPAGQGR